MNSNCRVRVVESLDEWREKAGEWNDLLLQSSSDSIFLTWEWLYTWAECFLTERRKLFILLVYNNDELVGIAPWCIHHTNSKLIKLKQIEFLGTLEVGSDYLDVFSRKGKEREVATQIYNFLFENVPSVWDSLMLKDLPSNSLFFLHFIDKIEEEGKYVEIRRGSFSPFVSLPGSKSDFVASLSPHRKQQYRRHLRILQTQNKVVHRSFVGRDVEAVLDDFLSFFSEKKGYSNEQFFLFLKTFALKSIEKQWVQIDMLISDTSKIVCLYQLRYRDSLSQYLMVTDKSFNPKLSVGNILVELCLENAISEKVSIYDFLKGTEPYKFHWANGGRSSMDLFFCQRKVSALLTVMGRFLKYLGKIVLK